MVTDEVGSADCCWLCDGGVGGTVAVGAAEEIRPMMLLVVLTVGDGAAITVDRGGSVTYTVDTPVVRTSAVEDVGLGAELGPGSDEGVSVVAAR
ncbi:hypothetical protein D5S17_02310 [Pseudonocardiaceae bacterium YIM PH 21723]|nr:hypothetical protein D5S17_02310 [Pseudonocardiaceae bacterium YIM PH 21723]